jgi:hypothetical protein
LVLFIFLFEQSGSTILMFIQFENNKWIVIATKRRRKGFSPKNLTETNNTYLLSTANRYKKLTNLQDMLAEDFTLKAQEENNASNFTNFVHRTKLQHQSRNRIQWIDEKHREDSEIYHIPTLLNGKIGNKNMETVSSVVTCRNGITKNKTT